MQKIQLKTDVIAAIGPEDGCDCVIAIGPAVDVNVCVAGVCYKARKRKQIFLYAHAGSRKAHPCRRARGGGGILA